MLSPSVTERLGQARKNRPPCDASIGIKRCSTRLGSRVSQGWLGGHTPLSMLATEDGGALIEEVLAALLYGDPV